MNGFLWLTIGGACTMELFQLSAGIDDVRVGAVGVVLVLSIVAMVSLRNNQLRVAAWLATSTVFSIACISIWLGGGIHAPGTATLLIMIFISATTLKWQFIAFWTLLSLVALSAFTIAEMQGWLPVVPLRRPLPVLWLIYAIHIAVAGWAALHTIGAFRGILGTLGIRSVALADSEERYSHLVEQSPDVIVALDGNGIVVECSPAIEALYGYAPDDLIGRPFRELGVIPNEWLEPNLDTFRSLLDGERSDLVETKVVHRDGTLRWAEANQRVVRREDGTVRIYLVIRDTTARVEAEKRRGALEKQLIEARRLEALGRMAGAIAHDFNNALLVIQSNADLLGKSTETPDRLLREIRAAADTASDLTAQLLAFAGRQVREVDGIDVNASLSRIEGPLRRMLDSNITLEIQNDIDLPSVRGDPAQYELAIVNLVMNAQQAMPEGGTVAVETANVLVTKDECQRFPGASAGGHVRIAVTDTGCGMDEETAEHIFEPFYSKRKGGTGLGLATVYGTVSQSRGHLRVFSRLGEGTRVEVLLPHSPRPTPRKETVSSPRPPNPSGETVVLLVDDQPAVLNAVCRLLESRGFRVLSARSLETARAISEQEPGRIDVLLSDVLMPGATGPKLASDLVAARPDMKVLLMSGYTSNELEEKDVLRGGVYFIAKPFSADALAEKLRGILRDSEPTRRSASSTARPPALG